MALFGFFLGNGVFGVKACSFRFSTIKVYYMVPAAAASFFFEVECQIRVNIVPLGHCHRLFVASNFDYLFSRAMQ